MKPIIRIIDESAQCDLFAEMQVDCSDASEESLNVFKEDAVNVLKRMILEAKRGNVQAAKLVFIVFPKFMQESEEINVWEELRKDDDRRNN